MKKNTISQKWLHLPILCMIASMLVGLFIFNSTLSDWLEKKVEAELASEITQVISKINEDNI